MDVDDPAPRLPLSPGERWFVLALALGFVLLLAADLAAGFSLSKLSVLFVLVLWVPVLLLHELAHALAARSVGWHVSEIVIGFGRELLRFRVGETRVRLRALPLEGYVLPSPSSTRAARAKQAWIYFAGPLSGLLVLWASGAWLGWRWPSPDESLGRIALFSLALAAGLSVLCTLIPYRSGSSPSDGLGMLASWLSSEESFRQRLCYPFLSEARRLLLREQTAQAIAALEAGLARYPDEPKLLGLRAVSGAAEGGAEAAFAALEALGPPEAHPSATRAELLADAAWAVLFSGETSLLPEAQRALEQALELAPGDPHYEILLGRVKFERSRPEEAYAHLMLAYKRTRDVDQEAQCVAHLALVCSALAGRPPSKMASYAVRFARAVNTHDVPPALRERVIAVGHRERQSESH